MGAEAKQVQRAAAQELLKRRNALESLSAFRAYMHPSGSVDFQHPPARHHLVMISLLEQLDRGEIQRLLILAPPGSAKSTYCSIQYPLQRLAKKPHENILCASNTQALAENFNRRRRNLALSAEWQTLSGTSLADDLQGVEHFGTKKQGGIRAAGVGSGIVGFRSHLNVLDDPVSGMEQALSPNALDKMWDWFNNEFRTRLVPTGRELIVSTRWAKRDIAGRILATEADRWAVLRLPMIADREDDPLGRQLGESLWPGYFDDNFIEDKRKSTFLWSTQFQQTPLDDTGTWVSLGTLEGCIEDIAPAKLTKIMGFDLALTVGRGDFTVIIVAGLCADGLLHVLHIERRRVDPQFTALRLFDLAAHHEPAEVLADDDNATKVFRSGLMETAKQNGKYFPLNLMPLRGKDKETRATPLRMLFLSGRIRFLRAHWNAELIRELLEWDTDDQIDALALIARRLPYMSAPEKPRENTDPYEGKRIRVVDGRMVLQEGLDEMFDERTRRQLAQRGKI